MPRAICWRSACGFPCHRVVWRSSFKRGWKDDRDSGSPYPESSQKAKVSIEPEAAKSTVAGSATSLAPPMVRAGGAACLSEGGVTPICPGRGRDGRQRKASPQADAQGLGRG